MVELEDHQKLIDAAYEQLKPIFEGSEQAIYLYLDDLHKLCNVRFATLLEYDSPEEWSGVEESFPRAFVAEESQRTLVSAYQRAMSGLVGSTIDVTWKKKSGGQVDTTVILVPMIYEGHTFALHFISLAS